MTMSDVSLRQQLSTRIARLIDWRIEHRIPAERLDGFDRRLGEHRDIVDHHEACIVDHRRRLDEIEQRFGELERLQRWTANEVERIIPSVSSQESQLESLRAKLAAVPAAGNAEVVAARSLIEEIQREHAQIKVRLTGIAKYEHRLRVVEDRTAPKDPS
jgi:chromosome segregation ATPase